MERNVSTLIIDDGGGDEEVARHELEPGIGVGIRDEIALGVASLGYRDLVPAIDPLFTVLVIARNVRTHLLRQVLRSPSCHRFILGLIRDVVARLKIVGIALGNPIAPILIERGMFFKYALELEGHLNVCKLVLIRPRLPCLSERLLRGIATAIDYGTAHVERLVAIRADGIAPRSDGVLEIGAVVVRTRVACRRSVFSDARSEQGLVTRQAVLSNEINIGIASRVVLRDRAIRVLLTEQVAQIDSAVAGLFAFLRRERKRYVSASVVAGRHLRRAIGAGSIAQRVAPKREPRLRALRGVVVEPDLMGIDARVALMDEDDRAVVVRRRGVRAVVQGVEVVVNNLIVIRVRGSIGERLGALRLLLLEAVLECRPIGMIHRPARGP